VALALRQTKAGLPPSCACAAWRAALALTNYFPRRLTAPAGLNEPPIYLVYRLRYRARKPRMTAWIPPR